MSPLITGFHGIVCDLDGVVYRGAGAVPHAVESLAAARAGGVGIAYATNNASRPPQEVHDHLASLGIPLDLADVVTSSMAGAHHLAAKLDGGARVLAVGGPGVSIALEAEGLTALRAADLVDGESGDEVAAVLQGFGRDVTWVDLSEAAFAIQRGAIWVATNADTTIPTARGIGPGNGTLVAAVRQAVTVEPEIVGKPYPPLYLRCAEHLGASPQDTLAIGDRLDTDIEGAHRSGMPSLFVLTGVHRARDVVEAPTSRRPTYLGQDLRALHEEYLYPVLTRDTSSGPASVRVTCGEADVTLTEAGFTLAGGGSASERLRAVVAAGHAMLDDGRDITGAVDWESVDAWIAEEGR